MMATTNGVDRPPCCGANGCLKTLRCPPPPPSNFPAVDPDTSGATSIREPLSRHQANASCDQRHRYLDPLELALENFDPVGLWRDFNPVDERQQDGNVVTRPGAKVDASAILPDGTRRRDIADLKSHVVGRIERFSKCLRQKSLYHRIGREMNYADKHILKEVASNVREQGNGFQDLIITVAFSASFRTR